MIEYVQQGRGERESGGKLHAVRLEGERQPKPDEDNADILDRVISEETLEIVLHERIEHAHDRRNAGKCEHDDAPPPGRWAGKLEGDAHEAVDGDLGHD